MRVKTGSAVLGLALVVALTLIQALAWPTPVAASHEYPAGPYWSAEFFDARWPTAKPVFTRLDPAINFDWGIGSPNIDVPVDDFSARWTRTVEFEGGNFRFWAIHDDGVLLWVDDQLLINQWYDQPAFTEGYNGVILPIVHEATVTLSPGPHRIKVEYYEHGDVAVIKVGWAAAPADSSAFVPPPTTLVPSAVHVVRPGEWLMKIARAYNVSVDAIIAANNLSSQRIVPGQRLIIPATTGAGATTASNPGECRSVYTVKTGDNLFRVALSFNTPLTTVAARNGLKAPFTIHIGQRLCIP